jgi:hypothetical protein
MQSACPICLEPPDLELTTPTGHGFDQMIEFAEKYCLLNLSMEPVIGCSSEIVLPKTNELENAYCPWFQVILLWRRGFEICKQ